MHSYEALKQHADTLRRELDNHRRLLEQADCEQNRQMDFCPHLQCPHEQHLQQVLQDVIDTLEETRKSFKSKQLEQLRRRMQNVLYTYDSR